MSDAARRWAAGPIVLGLAMACVLIGTVAGQRSDEEDIDQRVYAAVATDMRDGAGYYSAAVAAIEEKEGAPPSQVRSIRPPTLAWALARFPPDWWPWLAMLPALALCLAAACLAGPTPRAELVATAVAGLWMVVSLPLLCLHHELWGAPFVLCAAVAIEGRRDGLAAALCLAATVVRELFALSLVVGLVLSRDRRPWLAAIAGAGGLALLHARAASRVLDPAGFDPPLRATDPLLEYLSPGEGGLAQVLGVMLIAMAAVGLWRCRDRLDVRFLACSLVPVASLGVFGGRSYWALTWCGLAAALAGRAVTPASREAVGA